MRREGRQLGLLSRTSLLTFHGRFVLWGDTRTCFPVSGLSVVSYRRIHYSCEEELTHIVGGGVLKGRTASSLCLTCELWRSCASTEAKELLERRGSMLR